MADQVVTIFREMTTDKLIQLLAAADQSPINMYVIIFVLVSKPIELVHSIVRPHLGDHCGEI